MIEKIHWKEAEKLLGCRLDRRKTYGADTSRKPLSFSEVEPPTAVFTQWSHVATCSGCHETIDGYSVWPEVRDKHGTVLGGGCVECGHTGKVRHVEWAPVYPESEEVIRIQEKAK